MLVAFTILNIVFTFTILWWYSYYLAKELRKVENRILDYVQSNTNKKPVWAEKRNR